MPTIKLSRGQRTRVDWRDFRTLSVHKWHAEYNPTIDGYYAVHWLTVAPGKRQLLRMHRVILGLGPGRDVQVDHKNRDPLDNRRTNLRTCTNRENAENRRNQSKHGVGVTFDSRYRKPFRAFARVGRRTISVGRFATPEEAREARRKFVESIDGEKAR